MPSLPENYNSKMADLLKGKLKTNHLTEMSAGRETAYYQKLITDNLTFIEKQCHKACAIYKRKISSISTSSKDSPEIETQSIHVLFSDEIDPDTLVNDVIDRLREHNCKVLREFRGRSELTTYIGTIISNLVVDLIRKQKGRNRARDRGKAMGPIGERLYELAFEKGYPVEEAYEFLKENHHVTETLEEIEAMVDQIRGRKSGLISAGPVENAGHDIKSKLVARNDSEKELTKKQEDELAKKVLNQIVSQLTNEERFVIRMRFPLSEDEEPKNLSEMAEILGISEKAADGRIRRVLTRCREMMLKQGLSLDDLVAG